jgi:VanZ family protein
MKKLVVQLKNLIYSYQKYFFWMSFTLTAIALFMPTPGEGGSIPHLDKAIHFGMFFFFSFFAFLYLKEKGWTTQRVFVAYLFFIPMIELIQETVIVGRGYEFTDMLAGFIGVLSGYMVYKKYKQL